ncbi:MAG: alpha/beta hydrolase [Myxococcota bacterium]
MTPLLGHSALGTGTEGVIALHDWASDQTNWRALQPFVDTETFRFLFADLRGYGESRTLPPEFSAAAIARDVLALADHEKWDRFHVVGHSMTGLVPVYLSIHHADRIASATAITPLTPAGVPPDPALAEFFFNATTDDETLGALHAQSVGGAYGDTWTRAKIKQTRSATSPEVLQGYMALFLPSFHAELEAACPSTPLLAITGSRDMELFRREQLHDSLLRWFSNTRVETVESGHFPMMELPAQTAAILDDFLRAHRIKP